MPIDTLPSLYLLQKPLQLPQRLCAVTVQTAMLTILKPCVTCVVQWLRKLDFI